MTRLRNAVVAIASSGVVAACAAVTGLGDYEIVDCPGVCSEAGADGAIATPKPDAFAPASPNDSGGTDGAVPLDDAGPVDASVPRDAGFDAGPPLPAYAPRCGRKDCDGISAPSSCSGDPCEPPVHWPRTTTGGGTFELDNGSCIAKTTSPTSAAFASATIAGGARFDFELTFQGSQRGAQPQTSVMATIDSGSTSITLVVTDDKAKLCVGSTCGVETVVPGLASNDGENVELDIYGRWGDSMTNGYVRLLAGKDSAACSQRTELALPAPSSGSVVASTGCFIGASKCDVNVDRMTFSQRPL